MLTDHITIAELPSIDDTADSADWAERRSALQVRPLIEFPALRAAMGLTGFPTPAARSAASPAGTKRQPKHASAPATNVRTKHAACATRAAEPRFDRRTLLETDR